MLILPLADGFHNGLHAILLSGWQRIAHTSTCQPRSRFAHSISQRMAVDRSHLRLSMAFMPVCVLYCTADSIALRTHLLINGFHGLRAIFVSGWQSIARSSCHQCLTWFACRFVQRMATHCSFFRSSTAFTMVCVLYCLADGSRLLKPRLFNGILYVSSAVSLSGWQRIAHSSARQPLLQFTCRLAQWMAVYYSFIRLSTAFPSLCTPYC